ncbi:MAG: hypothetical protein ACLQMF_05665, partial [Rectinemataceae bacterium]
QKWVIFECGFALAPLSSNACEIAVGWGSSSKMRMHFARASVIRNIDRRAIDRIPDIRRGGQYERAELPG